MRGVQPLRSPRCELAHPVALLRAGVLLDLLVRRLARRHQDHPVQPQLPVGLLRTDEMPDVRRVEGSPEDPEPQSPYPRTWPLPCTTYLEVVSSRSAFGPRAC